MKDKEARERISLLEKNIGAIKIMNCPVCKHDVLAWFNKEWYKYSGRKHYLCLTCGTQFTCTNKEVCEIMKDAKNKGN